MAYQDNVQTLCDYLKIPNPIEEKSLDVQALFFKIDDVWEKFDGTRLNRGGRLLFQYHYRGGAGDNIYSVTESFKVAAANFFSENWEDAEAAGRPMLIALKKATHFRIHWK